MLRDSIKVITSFSRTFKKERKKQHSLVTDSYIRRCVLYPHWHSEDKTLDWETIMDKENSKYISPTHS